MIRFFAFCVSMAVITSCASQKHVTSPQQVISNQLNTEITKQHHVGFLLKDLETGKVVLEQNADKNFIAASNMKLFNLYVGLNMLGDSVPSFQYIVKGDSLLIWPMADPTFLHPAFKDQKAFDFLKNSGKNIYIVGGRYKGQKYGRGWAWDDYNESYQAEITDFPLYGNVVSCSQDSSGVLKLLPDLSSLYFSELSTSKSSTTIKRNTSGNNLSIPARLKIGYKQSLPISFNKNILESLLTDTLLATGLITSSVNTLPWRPVPAQAKIVYNANTKDVFTQMLHASDNFIAEQLLLNYAAANNLEMNGTTVISTASLYFSALKSSYQWVDGSGLSRLNLASPQVMVEVLEKIRAKVNNEQELFSLLPAGGKSGNLKNMFTANSETFIYAKSGSLSNNFNLSGYLIGKSGKRYVFSYLNNNFIKPVSEIKVEVERALTFVHEQY